MHEHADHPHGNGLSGNRVALIHELVHHLPFSVSAVAIGLTIAGLVCFLTPTDQAPAPVCTHESHDPAGQPATDHAHEGEHTHEGEHQHEAADPHEDDDPHAGHDHSNPFLALFHLFHPMHMFFSAAATTAMFWRYERKLLKALLIGLAGAIGVCGLSDIVMPQVSLMILHKPMPWHICVIEHPTMVLSFAAVGVLVGLTASIGVRQSTFFSHSLHVFSSTMASIFYLIGPFGALGWIDQVGVVFIFIIVAVMVPCCLSDIVFPLLLAGKARSAYRSEHTGCGCAG
jgi:hypothetical protein